MEETDTDDVLLGISNLKVIAGVMHDRSQNEPASSYTQQNLPFQLGNTEFNLYMNQKNPMSMLNSVMFLQISCIFKSKKKFELLNEAGGTISGQKSTGIHTLVFESVSQKGTSFHNLFGSNFLKGILNMGSMANSKVLIKKMLGPDDVAWRIVDCDNHLNGNPFTV